MLFLYFECMPLVLKIHNQLTEGVLKIVFWVWLQGCDFVIVVQMCSLSVEWPVKMSPLYCIL